MGRPRSQGKAEIVKRRVARNLDRIIEQLLLSALEGDTVAAKALLDRTWAPLKPQLERVALSVDADAPTAAQAADVMAALYSGKLAPDVGQALLENLELVGNLRALAELEKRLTLLEATHARGPEAITGET